MHWWSRHTDVMQCSSYNQAFTSAWKIACSAPRSVLLVPQGRRYLVNATKFNGPCQENLIIQVKFLTFLRFDCYVYISENNKTCYGLVLCIF